MKYDELECGDITFNEGGREVMKIRNNGEVWFNPELTPVEGAEEAWAVILAFSSQYNTNVRRFLATQASRASE